MNDKKNGFELLYSEQIKVFRYALVFIGFAFIGTGVSINLADPTVFDPIEYRIVISLLSFSLMLSTYISDFFIHKFYFFLYFLFAAIIIWAAYITYMNNFSFGTAFTYISAIAIITFVLKKTRLVLLFGVFIMITNMLFLSLSNIYKADKFRFSYLFSCFNLWPT